MSGDVRTARLSASGAVTDRRGRVIGLYFVAGSGAGTITIKDGGAGGPTVGVFDTPGGITEAKCIEFPGRGLLCPTSIYAVLTGVGFVTIFYEG